MHDFLEIGPDPDRDCRICIRLAECARTSPEFLSGNAGIPLRDARHWITD